MTSSDNDKNSSDHDTESKADKPSMPSGAERYFDKVRARLLLDDPAARDALLRGAEKKADQHKDFLAGSLDSLTTMFQLLGSHFTGRYRHVSKGSLISMVAGVLYFVNPMDLIPDMTPGIGFFDDMAVISFVGYMTVKELHAFRTWRRAKNWASPIQQITSAEVTEVYWAPGWLTQESDQREQLDMLQTFYPKATVRERRWDSNQSWSDSVEAAERFAGQLAEEIASRSRGDRAKIVLAGHSLGARVVAHALKKITDQGHAPLSHALLLGAAIDDTPPDGLLASLGRSTELGVWNLHSKSDGVVKYLYSAAESSGAAGATGFIDPPDGVTNVKTAGFEESVYSHLQSGLALSALAGRGAALARIAGFDRFRHEFLGLDRHSSLVYLKFLADALEHARMGDE
jgi:uncharacterized membrane protein YkvA (DUF1232 family)